MKKNIAYIGIGSNLGDKLHNCRHSINRISKLPGYSVTKSSAIFKTEPDGVTGQDWYINCVAQIETGEGPYQLLKNLLNIEAEMGRVREKKWGPRIIDLDILLFNQEIVSSNGLSIPHPLLHKRRFVLEPLAQLAPDVVHPVLQQTIEQLRKKISKGPYVEALKEEM